MTKSHEIFIVIIKLTKKQQSSFKFPAKIKNFYPSTL